MPGYTLGDLLLRTPRFLPERGPGPEGVRQPLLGPGADAPLQAREPRRSLRSVSSSSGSLCLNCVDPATACRKAHGEFGSGAFTFALASKQSSPCAAPAARAKPGEEKCAPNQGANNVGCGNKGDNNRG